MRLPGATLQGKSFMDFQVDPRLSGTIKSSCEVNGTVDAMARCHILGDSYLAGSSVNEP
jgi:hypothetical protein